LTTPPGSPVEPVRSVETASLDCGVVTVPGRLLQSVLTMLVMTVPAGTVWSSSTVNEICCEDWPRSSSLKVAVMTPLFSLSVEGATPPPRLFSPPTKERPAGNTSESVTSKASASLAPV